LPGVGRAATTEGIPVVLSLDQSGEATTGPAPDGRRDHLHGVVPVTPTGAVEALGVR
jgi:hypothetical protein